MYFLLQMAVAKREAVKKALSPEGAHTNMAG
jgi:hypothetical protein